MHPFRRTQIISNPRPFHTYYNLLMNEFLYKVRRIICFKLAKVTGTAATTSLLLLVLIACGQH